MTEQEIKGEVQKFLNSGHVLSLATLDHNDPWICTVFYGTDSDMNLYILTSPDTVHGKGIKQSPSVSVNIYDSSQEITKSLVGLQAKGKAELVSNPVEAVKAFGIWLKFNPGAEKKISVDEIKKLKDSRMYKIKLSYVKYFNKVLFGKDRYGIINL